MKGIVFNLQKFSVNDGPGIRTTVFLKGCPLNCVWCHNPESKSSKPELSYNERLCTRCGKCAYICSEKCHSFRDSLHYIAREKCIGCMKCVDVCISGALELAGEYKTAEEVIKEAEKDRLFYENSGGGITLSGGEPLYQFEFALEVLKLAKERGLHTCIETCGFGSKEKIADISQYVDIFLYDYKMSDPELHKKYTGVDNKVILDNLFYLDSLGKKIVLRCPVIPGINDTLEHFNGIAQTANALNNLLEINIEPYHPLGEGKAKMIGKEYPLEGLGFLDDMRVEQWISLLEKKTAVKVKKA